MQSGLPIICELHEEHSQGVINRRLVGLQGQRAGENSHCRLTFVSSQVDLTELSKCFRRIRVKFRCFFQLANRLGEPLLLRVREAEKAISLKITRVCLEDVAQKHLGLLQFSVLNIGSSLLQLRV